jgi:hypothetical protein
LHDLHGAAAARLSGTARAQLNRNTAPGSMVAVLICRSRPQKKGNLGRSDRKYTIASNDQRDGIRPPPAGRALMAGAWRKAVDI